MRNATLKFALAGVLILSVAVTVLAQETDPIAVLKSDADLKAKQDACIALSKRGDLEAVPVLEGLLLDAKLSHMARYALEPMPFPEAGEALRRALAKSSGKIKVGLMNSLANRGDTEIVPTLIAALDDENTLVVQEAARCLGVLATPECAKALTDALAEAGGPSVNRHAICDGVLRCAENYAAQGKKAEAIALYDLLLLEVPDAVHEVRTAALRGAVMARGPRDGLAILMKGVRAQDEALFVGALRTAREMDGGDAMTAVLAEALPELSDEHKIRLMQTLGHRGGLAAGPTVLAEAKAGSEEVRVAAVNMLARIGYEPALELFAQLIVGEDNALTKAARDALAYFPTEAGDEMLIAIATNDPQPKSRRIAVELIGRGGLDEPVGQLMKTVENDADESVRLAALNALENVAGIPQIPRLLAILREATSPEQLEAAENTLRAVVDRERRPTSAGVVIQKALYGDLPGGASKDVTAKVAQMVESGAMAIGASNGNFGGDPAPNIVKQLRIDYTVNGVEHSKVVREGQTLNLTAMSIPPAIVDAFVEAFEQAKTDSPRTALALLRLMTATGSPKALETVRAAAVEGEGEIGHAAERLLCDWPTPDAIPVVMEMAKRADDNTLKVLALRGAVRMLKESEAEPSERLEQLEVLTTVASNVEEKKQVLSGLAVTPTVEALEMAFEQFADEAVRAEAVQAAIAIAERLGGSAREESIFNGKDLTGWSSTEDYWRVEDGAIVGSSSEQIPDTNYLWSDVEAGDFYFAAEVMLEPPTANSGIQFRSKKIDEAGHALGYQFDVGQNVWGRLYHQGGRGKLDWNGRAEEAVKPGEWNRVEILAVGPAIWTAINGKLGVACLDLGTDELTGKFAFQIHTGPPQTHRYRNLELVHNPKIEMGELKADVLIPELTIPE
ncbi:MAG: family 16 glycoside hydrolase [Candidatus Hydrogenedentota bacterium]